MSQHERPMKISKFLRTKAQEFLANKKHSNNNLVEIMQHFESGSDTSACLLTLDLIFTTLLKERQMYIEIVPLKVTENTPENAYKLWLVNMYEDAVEKICQCFDHTSVKVQLQALATSMNLLAHEGKYPIENRGSHGQGVPLLRLKAILTRLLLSEKNSTQLINKFEEYLLYNDLLLGTWRIIPKLTDKSNPTEQYILNYLFLLQKMQIQPLAESKFLCIDDNNTFTFDENIPRRNLNKIWNCVMLWEHTIATHKQLLILLLERVLSHLDKPLLLTDFLMDSLDVGGPVSLLALQGIFTLIQVYNLEYPNIYGKLYSMFEPEIFHTKFKARLFHLADLFLSSTHLPETLVAAFAKRLSRLSLVAPPEDATIICIFIGNLILRHPGLKCLLNSTKDNIYTGTDPYIMDERDPAKSNAINSSLWEIHSLQQHVLPSVAHAATCISNGSVVASGGVANVEHDLGKYLDETSDDIFDREIKRNRRLIAGAFERPQGGFMKRGDSVALYWEI